MIHSVLLLNRQGKVRVSKNYTVFESAVKDNAGLVRFLKKEVLTRHRKLCNVVEWRDVKVVYKRYAALYFVMCVDRSDNELMCLEIIHQYVELLDQYFTNVCELDIIYHFQKAHYILDELIQAGEMVESSRRTVSRLLEQEDLLHHETSHDGSVVGRIISHIVSNE